MSKSRIAYLEDEIIRARNTYYNNQAGLGCAYSDRDYDALEAELRELDPENALFQKVGATPRKNRVPLEHPMYSLEKAKGADEFSRWYRKHGDADLICSHKMDGCALDLCYERIDGGNWFQLTGATTRGDGTVGEDVSVQVINGDVRGIPHYVNDTLSDYVLTEDSFHVYGEVVINKSTLVALNMRQRTRHEEPYSNTRNLANGSVSLEDIEEVRARRLKFHAYNTSWSETSLDRKYDVLYQFGFQVVYYEPLPYALFLDWYERLSDPVNREKLEYDIDGLVVALNHWRLQERLGYTGHHPKWAVAVKFPDETAVVTIKDIEWTVSKFGTVTPQAIYDPVQLGGAELERVTLHNAGLVMASCLSAGAKIEICRSGGVIPYLKRVICASPNYDPACAVPRLCPVCNSVLEVESVELKCRNALCSARVSQSLNHFLEMIEFKGIGEKICDALVKADRVQGWADLWTLAPEHFVQELNWSEEHAISVYTDLQEIKQDVPMEKLLRAFQVEGLGRSIAREVAQKYSDIGSFLFDVDAEQWFLRFGPTTGPRVYQGLRNRAYHVWPQLHRVGFTIKQPAAVKEGALKIVITGTLSKGRKEYEKAIEEAGHIFQKSLSKDTDVLVCGANVGSGKTTKAAKYGTQVQDEKWLQGLIAGTSTE